MILSQRSPAVTRSASVLPPFLPPRVPWTAVDCWNRSLSRWPTNQLCIINFYQSTDVDHYLVLGLPSGEEGSKLTEKEISKAYKLKALELHPDKWPDDPNAHANFQKLKSSYEILKDEKARKLFDDLLRVKREKQQRQSQQDGKRQKMMSDLEEKERAVSDPDPAVKARQEEERIARQLKEEIARVCAMHASKGVPAASTPAKEMKQSGGNGGGVALDKEKVLKVTWEKSG